MNGRLRFTGRRLGQMLGIIMLGTSCLIAEADERYGLGVVYAKTGKLRHADHHYRRAADINPTNAVLLSSIGFVSYRALTDETELISRYWSNWKIRQQPLHSTNSHVNTHLNLQ
jgi:hypothetical protein